MSDKQTIRLVHTITAANVGNDALLSTSSSDLIWLPDLMGCILPGDVGKRIFAVESVELVPISKVSNIRQRRTVYQVENDEQRDRRIGTKP